MTNNLICPCCSGKSYQSCCEKFHSGENPPTAESLMRSRFSAYSLGLIDYIIKTTHPKSKESDLIEWKKKLLDFCHQTTFKKLDVRDAKESDEIAFVTFIAYLKQGDRDTTFTEESRFEKVNGQWLYHSGKVFLGAHLL